jgi:drug/metabolite transporter (DMT)-like permease
VTSPFAFVVWNVLFWGAVVTIGAWAGVGIAVGYSALIWREARHRA